MRSRGKREIRRTYSGEAIQCRGRNIRICGLYYWIASRLDLDCMLSLAALRNDELFSFPRFIYSVPRRARHCYLLSDIASRAVRVI
ncbi:MAG: hypothetical protein LBM98_10000 [Oscillospiraceae bacterium]|nr:hypothetical protein [Oscillospiraceae bacterium]